MFGSRGRGDFSENSDYDFMAVLDENLENNKRRKLAIRIRQMLLSHQMLANIDLIIKNKDNWEWESKNLGFLSYTVKNEGILL